MVCIPAPAASPSIVLKGPDGDRLDNASEHSDCKIHRSSGTQWFRREFEWDRSFVGIGGPACPRSASTSPPPGRPGPAWRAGSTSAPVPCSLDGRLLRYVRRSGQWLRAPLSFSFQNVPAKAENERRADRVGQAFVPGWEALERRC